MWRPWELNQVNPVPGVPVAVVVPQPPQEHNAAPAPAGQPAEEVDYNFLNNDNQDIHDNFFDNNNMDIEFPDSPQSGSAVAEPVPEAQNQSQPITASPILIDSDTDEEIDVTAIPETQQTGSATLFPDSSSDTTGN